MGSRQELSPRQLGLWRPAASTHSREGLHGVCPRGAHQAALRHPVKVSTAPGEVLYTTANPPE